VITQVLSADERKRRLDLARSALRSGSAIELRQALGLLPDDGSKANVLRSAICQRLAEPHGAAVASQPPSPSHTGVAIVSGDYRFCFSISDFHVATLFVLRPKGGTVEIAINSSHPAFPHLLADDQEHLCPAAERALLAWVMLLLHAGSEKKKERIEELCAEWAYLLAESPAEPYWGHGYVG